MQDPSRILVLTVAIGIDYRKGLQKALDSKRAYCKRHGYTYHELHEEVWNRDRPIAWSKVPVWKQYASEGDKWDYIWISDADVFITNPEIRLEDHVLHLLPPNKELLLTYDSCQHVNTGNMILRPSAWAVAFFDKVWNTTETVYHIWFENYTVIRLMASSPEDMEHIECTIEAWRFNAYLRGYRGTRLWQPGDFLVHFAGCYDPTLISNLILRIENGEIPRLPM